jgi:hypothetical protein
VVVCVVVCCRIRTMNLCEYSEVFGKPRTGVHSLRLFDFAVVDILLTGLLGIAIWRYFKVNLLVLILVLILLSITSHTVFCVDTKLNSIIGDASYKRVSNGQIG